MKTSLESPLRVLLVEDNPNDERLIRRHLTESSSSLLPDSVNFHHAESLDAGVTILADNAIDLLLLDLGLPESEGTETYNRARECFPDVPIVVLTNLDDDQAAVEILNRGAQDYLNKQSLNERNLIRAVRYAVERWERQRELERNREFLKQTQEVAAIGGWKINFRTDTQQWTDEMYRIHGLSQNADPIGEDGFGFYHPEDQNTIREAFDRLITEGEPYDLELRIDVPDDDIRWVRTIGDPLYEDGEMVGANGTMQDITERKEREQELERHRKIIQTVDDGVYVLDETGHFELVNDAMTELTGYDTEELLGEHTSYIKSDEVVERAESTVRSMIFDEHEDAEVTLELDIQRSDGSEFPAEDHLTLLWDDDGERFEGTTGIIRNITERKQREQELQNLSEKLEVLNRILRHDIQNDTQTIQLWTEEIQNELSEDHQETVRRIKQTNKHIQELTENSGALIQTLTQGELKTNPVHLDEIVRSELESARSRYPEAELTVDGSLTDTVVSANGTLSSVVRNLLNNAVQHNRGEMTVTVQLEQDDEFAQLCVLDNGPGVPDEQKDKIFGKGERGMESEGTGIGLYLVNQLTQSYGGEVWVKDREQHQSGREHENCGGAVFVVKLPTANGWI
ncbi:PAS domain S-box protein [Halovenus rubra]|uniref:histidine kinase n=2 Tax=Halovenus rubra TaxID=869890 RepID=A0ABD5X1K3_9EURY|nr:PAS domain S-box protein [Halovenus rubra]